MLRIQQYERLMKALLTHHEVAGPVDTLEAQRATCIEKLSDKSLGTLVKALFESCTVARASPPHTQLGRGDARLRPAAAHGRRSARRPAPRRTDGADEALQIGSFLMRQHAGTVGQQCRDG